MDPNGSNKAEELGAVRAELVVNSTTNPAQYQADCLNNLVPLPPAWGRDNIGPGKSWLSRGTMPRKDTFNDFGPLDVYFASANDKNGTPGLCVIAAHNENAEDPSSDGIGSFDIICQGASGKACFWEGRQLPGTAAPVPASVDLLGAGWTAGGSPVVPPASTFCTNCHSGQNAFITHYGAPLPGDVPQNPLAPPTGTEIQARPGLQNWMPGVYGAYDPIGSATTSTDLGGTVPAKDTFTGYPAPGVARCHLCHSAAPGGGFPLLTTSQLTQDNKFCTLLWKIANRPASVGGMPPTWSDGSPNECTTNFDCALQRDPFVQKMILNCGRSDLGQPGESPAFTRDVNPGTPFLFNTPSPHAGVHFVAVYPDGARRAFLPQWIYKYSSNGSDDDWGLPANRMPPESTTANFFTADRPVGYLKAGAHRSFVVKSYASLADGFGQIGDVYERDIDSNTTTNVTNGSVIAQGSPAPIYRSDFVDSIYVAASDGWLHQFDWNANTGSWGGNYNLHNSNQADQVKSSPIAYTGINGSIVVAFACGSVSACEMRYSFSSHAWTEVVVTSPKVLVAGTRPMAIFYNGAHYTFFNTTSGLYMASDSTGSGYGAVTRISTGTSRFFSSPMPYVRADGKLEVLINYLDSLGGSNVYAYTLSSGSWLASSIFSLTDHGTKINSDPVGYVRNAQSNLNGILFLDTSYNVRNVQQSTSGGAYRYELGPGHDGASTLIPGDSWKQYAF
jgi:hypothetical protein